MTEDKKSGLGRKFFDYCIFGGGIHVVSDGIIRIANNPPEHIFYINNLDNWQYQISLPLIAGGGAMIAYGIERIVKYCRRER